MSFNIQTPISYVRSTNEKPSIVERRHRPDFLPALTVDTFRLPRASHSPSATSEISPSVCPSLSPGLATASGTPCSAPSTPVDEPKPHPTHQNAKNSIDPVTSFSIQTRTRVIYPILKSPTLTHVGWLLETPGPELDDTNANPAHFDSPIQRPADPAHIHHPANAESESRSSPAQRVSRRRSGRSHNRDQAIANPVRRTLSTHYRALSEKERRVLKLDVHKRHYKCLMDGCERMFARKSNVENHIRTHLDDKPFVCSQDTW
ncbi:C2H2 zinc finger [Ceratobasidium sp. AG-Ba]|nr:C2H2 zinc finger [Ceratobasidium sp. AG-Ba]QRW04765.1 C2H2 zinc finger [Ceratobasidium sp. AG-Ba]